MVGRVAMAAAAAASPSDKDGDAQPCKKRREDDPSVKAITNYFSPLAKNVDGVLSPPKSNNIMDYFKKTSPSKEKIASPVAEKESKTDILSLEVSSKPLTKLKRRGKKCNLNNKLKDMRTLNDTVNDDRGKYSPKEEDLKINSAGQNVPELLESSIKGTLNDFSKNSSNVVSGKDEEIKQNIEENVINNIKRSKKRKHKDETDVLGSFIPESQLSEQSKEVDEIQLVSTSEPENISILGPENETIQLNDSTVTVSFEDFLKSQTENKADEISKDQTPDHSVALGESVSCQAAQVLPLKKVTVLAEIHPVPPKSLSSRNIASIFLKQKPKAAKRQSNLSTLEVEFTEQITQKRKSNVVIAEEELELAVLETPNSETAKSKCTAEERYQFMKAFRQPESDTIKNGAKKGSAKQKEMGENSSKLKEESEEVPNKKLDVPKDCVGSDSQITGRHFAARVKNNKLRRKQVILETKVEELNINESQNSNANNQIKVATAVETQSKLPQSRLRRSLRQKKKEASINITPKKVKISGAATENTATNSPLHSSTPKSNNNSFSKSELYKAEMITEPFDAKSPIRMKFTRILTSEGFSQQSLKMNPTCNNISKAKKLIEKAKALQHNKARITEETLCTPLRRSSRQQALAKKKILQNTEESIIILDSSPSNVSPVSEVVEKQKILQNLNDVLGKKTGNTKATKKLSGKEKVSSLFRKKVQKPATETIMISEESSEDESENSQDDEQFKAKRKFLMSGLPESLKRQIAKKAEALEAYSATNSCFRIVVHVQQKDEGCLMWSLTPPSCSLLTNLRENLEVTDIAQCTFSLGEFSVVKAQSNSTDSAIIVSSGWRPVLSETVRNCLLEEIKASNPQFPAKTVFDILLKKQVTPENSKQVNKCEAIIRTSIKSDNRRENKRKRKTEGRKHKRRKQTEKVDVKLSNTASKDLCVKQADLENKIHTMDNEESEVPEIIAIEDGDENTEINSVSDSSKEDVLWTEKYQPQNSNELIGNATAIKKLHRWLSEWKKRAYLEENKARKEEKSGNQEEFLDSMDFKGDKPYSDEETELCNTVLLVGPSGVGKTTAVYACAQELGFKIFEVNASCQRSGRQILSQLKEATQSHQVDKQGVNAHKPCFFNSTKSPRKFSPRKEWSPKKPPVSPRKAGLKQGLAPKTLTSYFKINPKEEKVHQENNKGRKENLSEDKVQMKPMIRGTGEEESNKKNATSLILFEEVDIIFDEDVGFLNAIKIFMATTKRPVILTTNDPSFSLIFDGLCEEITFIVPSLINVASYLQVLCLAENLRTDIGDLAALLTTNNCDIRQSLLHLQFWVRSGGGCLKEKSIVLHGGDKMACGMEQTTSTDGPAVSKTTKLPLSKIPKCDTGCIENLLGLKNIFLPSEDLLSFLKHEITCKEEWSKLIHLLTEFQVKNVDFIYNNLELILPLPVTVLSKPTQRVNLPIFSNYATHASDHLEEASPMKKSKQTKHQRRIALLDDSDLFESELNYSDFMIVPSDVSSSCKEEEKGGLKAATDSTILSSGMTEAKGSAHAFQCLNSLTEFVENMSLLDYCLNNKSQASKQSCKYEEFIWTEGKLKDGLSDEFSEEHTDWWSSKNNSELKATMEALAFKKCFKDVSEAMQSCLNAGKDGFEQLTLCISKEQNYLHFDQLAVNSSIHEKAQKRMEIIKAAFSSRTPFNLSNRQVGVIEYLPTLRNICKSEKQKEQGKAKRRFLHYLDGIHCDFPRELLNNLAADFP